MLKAQIGILCSLRSAINTTFKYLENGFGSPGAGVTYNARQQVPGRRRMLGEG